MTNLTKALLKVQQQIGAIAKDSQNPFFKSSYLSLNGVRDAVIPVLSANNVVLLQPTVYLEGKTFVSTRLIHSESGETIEGLTEVVTSKAGDAQNFGSGLSYSRRYGLMSLLCLAAEDDDANTATGKTNYQPKAPAVTITKTLPEAVTTAAAAPTKAKPSFSKKSVASVETAPVTLSSEDDL